jgi:hypothetical protein
MEYKLANLTYIDVSKYLNEGWKLYGNPFVAQSGDIIQAMVKVEEKCAVCTADKNLMKKT